MTDQTSTNYANWNDSELGKMVELSKSQWKPGDKDQRYIGLEHINVGELSINGFGISSKLASNKFCFEKGDILFGKLRPYFRKVWKAKFDGVCSTDIWVLKAKKGFDQNFIFYLVANPVFIDKTMGANIGTHMPRADWGFLKNTIWNVPRIEEQQAIAAVLSSLDDKINLLHKQNITLEATAQAIFKEWFVNFNFPGSTGKMVDSEFGEIPEGWRVGKLGEFIDVRGGLSYDGSLISKTGTPMITMGFVSGEKRYEETGIKYYLGHYNQQYQINAGSLVIATRDVTQDRKLIGSPAIIPNYFGNTTIIAATNLYIVQNINFLPNRFLYWVMRTSEYRERVIGACKGTTIVMITKDSVLDYEFVIPKKELVEKFSAINETIFNRLELVDNQIHTLSALRDTLLPKLMKGEVRVRGFN